MKVPRLAAPAHPRATAAGVADVDWDAGAVAASSDAGAEGSAPKAPASSSKMRRHPVRREVLTKKKVVDLVVKEDVLPTAGVPSGVGGVDEVVVAAVPGREKVVTPR